MRKKLLIEELDNYILPRCTVCAHHRSSTDEDKILHYCEYYGGLTLPETLDMCDEDGSFKEVP